MNNTKELYLKLIHMKMYLGLYFAAFIFFYGVLCMFFNFESIRILVLLEMAFASLFIALFQVILLPDHNIFTKKIRFIRTVLWFLCSLLITFLFAYFGNWFIQMPTWTLYLFMFLACIGFFAMRIGLHFLQEADTIHLNAALHDYQENK